MSNSSLIAFSSLSPNKNIRKNATYNPTGKISKITIHHAAGRLTAKQLCNIFAPKSRGASANYCIGYDGTIALCVPEDYRAWTSSSKPNDYVAVTIEVSDDTLAPNWTISEASMTALINLCIDICKRNDIKEIVWDGSKSGSLTCHYMFAATACPGPYLKAKMPEIAQKINAGLLPEKKEESVKQDTVSTSSLEAGTKLDLNDVNLYGSSSSSRRSSTKTGTFYLWSNEVINGRMKITNSTANVGKDGQVTGWINEADVKASVVSDKPAAPKKLSASELADAIIANKYGVEPNRTKNLKAEGYTDAEIKAAQDIVNARYNVKKPQPTVSTAIGKGDLVKFKSSATKWATGENIPNWVKAKALYVRSEPVNNKCQVSTVKSGAITGVAFVKDLNKV